MKDYKKFNSFLYKPPQQFHKMTLRELCDYGKITNELDNMSHKKIKRIEKWSPEKRERKMKKFLNKKKFKNTRKKYKNLKKRTIGTKKLKFNKKYFTLHLIE